MSKRCVGSASVTLDKITAGLERNMMSTTPVITKKNLMKLN
jgi:hypothetical protein